jgi:hypothetical protein
LLGYSQRARQIKRNANTDVVKTQYRFYNVLSAIDLTRSGSFDKRPKPLHALEEHRQATAAAVAPLASRAALTPREIGAWPGGQGDTRGAAGVTPCRYGGRSHAVPFRLAGMELAAGTSFYAPIRGAFGRGPFRYSPAHPGRSGTCPGSGPGGPAFLAACCLGGGPGGKIGVNTTVSLCLSARAQPALAHQAGSPMASRRSMTS